MLGGHVKLSFEERRSSTLTDLPSWDSGGE